ncbi:diadenylate cyclase CdaA [Aristaeella lactis]|uniref:Diadenylate cyclase n=1 Tax=Aristaeella lactis TaxID=3046383 RepID=A0AC61PJ16_9FIRM|nr:diadenylate cyclase CdaA [Aristaeella lactis]QUA53944.1 diadenylate cyclase CdaA [Aristaeella lactis]SMC41390.1 diadenylate cyclase [Aristaeella lactis]
MNDIWSTIRGMAWSLTHRLGIIDVIDILIVAVIIYELLLLTRHTRGSALLKGLFLLFLIVLLSNILGLTSLNWLLLAVLQNGAIVLVVLFQPELRKALERMGRSRLITKGSHRNADEDTEVIIEEIVQTVVDLSRRRVGALLVFERKTGLQDVVETGTMLNSEISAPLLENIFEPNTPLHDGAVVIRDDRVMAAACILPLAEASGVIRGLGTRHRAAVGITENTDAAVIVVSEQTGIVSFAADGMLKRPFTVEDIKAFLHEFYTSRASGIGSILRRLKKRFTEEKTA